jgi:hypothetical protein
MTLAVQIMTRSVNWAALYAQKAGQDVSPSEILSRRFVTIDFVTPIATAIIAATYPEKTQRSLSSDSIPQEVLDELITLVNSEQWNQAIHNAFADMVIFGTGFVQIGEVNGRLVTMALPFYTTAVADPMDDSKIIEASYAWIDSSNDIILRTIRPGRVVTENKSKNRVIESLETADFVPVVTLKNPLWALRGTPYGFPLITPAIDWSFYASGIANDLAALAHSHSFSMIVISGANGDELELAADRAIVLPDSAAKATMLMPDAKFTELNDIIDSAAARAAISCSVPPDIVRPRSLSNTGSGAVSLQYAPLLSLAERLRRELRRFDQQMLAYCLSLMAPNEFPDIESAKHAVKYDIGYVGRQEELLTLDRVQSLVMAVQNHIVPIEDAIRIMNPGIDEEKVSELADVYNQKVETELASKQTIASMAS